MARDGFLGFLLGKHGGPTAEVVMVTPEVAATILEKQGKNRRLNPKRVTAYARQVRLGQWFVTGDTIKFDENDRLVDGQHRLAAIVAAGKGTYHIIVRGILPEALVYIDQGQPRSTAQALTIAGTPLSEAKISISKALMRTYRPSPDEVITFYKTYSEGIDWVISEFKGSLVPYGIGVSPLKAAIVRFYYRSPQTRGENLKPFLDVLFVGESEEPNHRPAMLLRQRLINTGRRVGSPLLIEGLALGALKAFLDREPISRLPVLDPTNFPLPGEDHFERTEVVDETINRKDGLGQQQASRDYRGRFAGTQGGGAK